MSITRTAIVDDDGTGTTGTIYNNAWKVELYDQIDAADLVATPRTCRVGNASGTLSIPTGVMTPITFATESFDGTGMHSTSSNPERVTAVVAGVYLAVGGIFWTAQALDSVTLLLVRLAKSGTLIEGARSYYPPVSTIAANGLAQVVSAIVDLTVGQYVTIDAFHDAVGARTVNLASCSLQLVYLGP